MPRPKYDKRCVDPGSKLHEARLWHSHNFRRPGPSVQALSVENPPHHKCVACQVKITGDHVDFGEAALIICNHRTRVDWMFLWVLCLRQGQLSGLKIVLKESLKGIPGFGWATQVINGIFFHFSATFFMPVPQTTETRNMLMNNTLLDGAVLTR